MGGKISRRRHTNSENNDDIPELYGDQVMTANGALNHSQMQAMLLSTTSDLAFIRERPPPPKIEKTITIQNYFNLNKQSLKIIQIENDINKYGIKFKFDSKKPCQIELFFMAIENGLNIDAKKRSSQYGYPDALNQVFDQRNHAEEDFLDISEYNLEEELSYDQKLKRYPLIVKLSDISSKHAQMTYVSLKPSNSRNEISLSVLKQKIKFNGKCYELQEIFGINEAKKSNDSTKNEQNCDKEQYDESDEGSLCIICLSEPRTLTVIPCRHMCLCEECADALRKQSNTCPVCRTAVQSLLQIDLNDRAEEKD